MKKAPIVTLLALLVALSAQWAQAADYTNSIGMKFKNIPAGSFYMGSCKLSAAEKKANKKRQFMGLPAKGVACPYRLEALIIMPLMMKPRNIRYASASHFKWVFTKSRWGNLKNSSLVPGVMI